ncbi:MAG: phosphate ABC transporter permease PstA [Bacteriovoracaceae bacterium]|nr:phosphate ABC transporter permease PstA [Bacteriovoracaceae bacterium]
MKEKTEILINSNQIEKKEKSFATIHPGRRRAEKAFKWISRIMTWSTVFILLVLLYHLGKEGWEYIDWQFLDSYPSRKVAKAGIKAGLWGTVWLIITTAVITIPIGVASALFLEEYGVKGKIGKLIEINVSNLAGVPSIVYGLLGLAVFVRWFNFERSILSGALTLGLLIMPVIIVATREAVKAVPDSIRFGAYALGAHKWQVVFYHVLPVALPGIITGVILALSRAIGETAPLIIIGALAYVSFVPESVMDEFTVMPIQIYNWASRPQEEFHQLAASGIVALLALMLTLNFIAVFIRIKTTKRNIQ